MLSALLVAILLCACGGGDPQPTRVDVERAMRASWETSGSNFAPRASIEFNEIKFGSTHPANEQDVIDGIPPGGAVTAAPVDFTVRTYYNDTTEEQGQSTFLHFWKKFSDPCFSLFSTIYRPK